MDTSLSHAFNARVKLTGAEALGAKPKGELLGAGTFDVGPFTSTKSATLTVPTTPGSYAFHCRIHPTMHGTLVVQ